MTDSGGVLGGNGVALRWGGAGGGIVADEKGPTGKGEAVVDLETSMREVDPGLMYGGQASHRGRAKFRGELRGFVHMVEQSVRPGFDDVGVEVGRGWLTDS